MYISNGLVDNNSSNMLKKQGSYLINLGSFDLICVTKTFFFISHLSITVTYYKYEYYVLK